MTATPNLDHITQLIEQQSATTAALTQAKTFREIAAVVAQHMLIDAGQFISINMTDYNEAGEIKRLRTVASANRTQSFDVESAVELVDAEIGDDLRAALYSSMPVVVAAVETNAALGETYRKWLMGHKVKAFVSLPMRHAGRSFGSLTLSSMTGDLDLSAQELNLYQTIADQVGGLIQVHNLTEETASSSDLNERQAKAFDELSAGQSFEQMAAIVARHLLRTQGRFVSLSKVVYDATGNLTGLKILATANRSNTYNWDIDTLNWDALGMEFRDSVAQGRPFIIEDVDKLSASDLGPGLYALFATNGIKSFIHIPMMLDNKPIAAMGIASRLKTTFNKAEINAFRNLCDQVATLIHARTLLEDSQASRDVANNLVLASRMITSAENYEDMAQAVIYTLARKMSAVSISLFDRPIPSGEVPQASVITAIGTPDGPLTFDAGRFTNLPPNEDQIESLRRGLPLVINDINAVGSPLSDDTQGQYIRLGVGWFAAFGLRAGDQLIGTLDIANSQAYPLSPEETDAYNTLADQIAITLENRNLLSQTEETLNFVQAQFEATNKIYVAKDGVEMLDAIYHFAGSGYNHGHIALVDSGTMPPTVRVIAEINHNQLAAVERQVTLDSYPASEALSALETLYVPDTKKDNFLTMTERERLIAQDIGAMVIVPLVSNQRLTGVVVFIHPTAQSIPPNRLRALRSMADQAAVVFENQTLLKSTEQALDETRLLYEVNRSILASQDTLDVLHALRTHLVPDATTITHMIVGYDEKKEINSIRVDFINSPTGDQVIDFALDEVIGVDALPAMTRYWNRGDIPVSLVEDIEQDSTNPMTPFYRTSNIRSSIVLPVREQGLMRQSINITFSEPQTFGPALRRLYEGISDQIAIVLQSHRLLRDTQMNASQLGNQVRVLQLVNQLSSMISTSQDEQTLLDESAHVLAEAVGVDHIGIVIVNPQESSGTVVSEYPMLGTIGTQIELEQNELYQLIRETQKPLIVDSVADDSRVLPATKDLMKKNGIIGFGFFPIILQDRIFGSIGLDITQPGHKFTPEMMNIAQTITSQIAIGLQNTRLLTDTQRRADQLQRITAFSQSVQATLDLSNIFNIMLAESGEMLQQDQMSIGLYDTGLGQLRTVAQQTDGITSVNLNAGETIPIKGYIAKVWESWQILHIQDAKNAPEKIEPKTNARSLIVAPLISRGRILGIVSAGSTRAYAYTDTDLAVFQQMVNQLAVAIENAEAFRQSQRVAKNESLVNDISTQLQRQMDIHSMLDVTVNELGKVLGARRARIRLGTSAPSPDDSE
ncbi:MAG: GAF domain-containing protein [Chloroflexota bacterium]